MARKTGTTADWRDAAAYAPLIDADPSLFAWEWLRRDPRYVEAASVAMAACHLGSARSDQFGLVRFEPFDHAVPHARPLWTKHAHPPVLEVARASPGGRQDMFNLGDIAGFVTIIETGTGEHLLLSDGLRALRLDGPRGTFPSGPQSLCYRLCGLASAQRPLLTLRRFLALCSSGGFARSLHPRAARARRWITMLRTYDALLAGADQREIARELISRTAGEPRWRSRESSVRARAQRLVRSARQFADGAYRSLLR